MHFLTSENIRELERQPKRLVVLGGLTGTRAVSVEPGRGDDAVPEAADRLRHRRPRSRHRRLGDSGVVEVLTVPGKDKILGVTIVGMHAGDLIAEYVLAMKHGLGLNKILGTIHIYPTLSEANKYAAGEWKRAHQPERLLGWTERFHAWRRGEGAGDTPAARSGTA